MAHTIMFNEHNALYNNASLGQGQAITLLQIIKQFVMPFRICAEHLQDREPRNLLSKRLDTLQYKITLWLQARVQDDISTGGPS